VGGRWVVQLYDRHSTTAKGVDETVNWNLKDPHITSLLNPENP
jgi:hypothetical protein